MGKFRDWLARKKTRQAHAAKTQTEEQPNHDGAWSHLVPNVQLIPKSPLTTKGDEVVILANDINSASVQTSKSVATRNPDCAAPIPTQNPLNQLGSHITSAFGINHALSPSSPTPPPAEDRVAVLGPSIIQATSSFPPPASYQPSSSIPVQYSQQPRISSPPSPSSQVLSVTPKTIGRKNVADISLEVGKTKPLKVEPARSSQSPLPPQPPLELLEHPSPVLENQITSKPQPSLPLARGELQKLDSYSDNSSNLKSRSHFTPRLPINFPLLNLIPELILKVADHLDYSTRVLLSISCKKLHDLIPIQKHTPEWPQKRVVLQKYPSIRTFAGDRSVPYLCWDCQMWHTFEHMVIWPNPQSENRFSSYTDFKNKAGRICTRYAIRHPQFRVDGVLWIPGQALNDKYFLCKDCKTPSKYPSSNKSNDFMKGRRCQWNCGICGRCTERKSWSAYCNRCWRPGYSTKMWNDDPDTQPLQPSLVDEKKVKICGLCLGKLTYSAESRENCRCREPRHNSTSQMWYS